MAARNQDFVVKNGLQVTSNLVVGDLINLPYSNQIGGGAIFTTNVGIGTSDVPAGTRLNVVGGNIRIQTPDYGLVFSDGSIQRTSAVNAVVPGGIAGSVQYNGGTSFVGSSSFVFDGSNTRLGIGTTVASNTLDVYGNLHLGNTATTSGIRFPDGTYQTTAAFYTPSYGTAGTIQFAGISNSFSGNGTNLYWDFTSNILRVSNVYVSGPINATGAINTSGYVIGQNMTANATVGIGTATATYPLDVYGNVHIGNTATTSGIRFPDGTYQTTAAFYTPSYGPVGTLQLAGANNTFSGNGSSLYWDSLTNTLNTANLFIGNNMTVAGNFTVAGTTTFTNVAISSDLIVNSITSNTFVQSASRMTTNSLYANVNVGIGTSSMAYPLDIYGNIHIGNTATGSGIIFPDGTFQTTAVTPTPSYGPQYTIQFAGTGNAFSGDSSNLAWDATNKSLLASNISVPGTASMSAAVASGSITAASISSNTSVQAAQRVTAGQIYANVNVGIGTATISYPLDLYGNLHIGNTATTSGIVFPDGTYQTTAAVTTAATPSYGPQYTIQFAGTGNAFSGDGARLFWYSQGASLVAGNLTVTGITSTDTLLSNAIIGNVYGLFGQNVTVNSTNASTSTTNGALVLGGGAGIAGNINVGGSRSLFSGYVGLGTTSASGVGNVLVVYGSESIYGNVVISNSSVGSSGIYFPDGTFQSTASYAAALVAGSNKSIQFNDGGTFGGTTTFIYDKATNRVGIGTASATNSVTVYGSSPALFNTTGGSDQQIIVGNTSSDGALLAFNSGASTAYGYIKYAGSSLTNIAFTKVGTGIGGITVPINTLDIGGATAIGFAYAGVQNAPGNGLIVQGRVGIGTYSPGTSLDVNGWASIRQGLSVAGTAWADGIIANTFITAASVNATGALVAQSINSNTNVVATNLQSTGQASVGSLASNGAISGTTIDGTAGTFTSLQDSGSLLADSINSNTNVVATNLQSTGQASLASSIVNANSTTSTLNVQNGLISGSINSNTNVVATNLQSTGQSSLASLVVNANSTTSTLNVQNSAVVGSSIVNANSTTSTLNVQNSAVVGSLVSNGAISAASLAVASLQVAGTTTTNALVSNVYGLFGQNVTINSTNTSTSKTTGALIVAGGVGVSGNVYLSNLNVGNHIDLAVLSTTGNTAPAYQEGRIFYDNDQYTAVLWADSADVSLPWGEREVVICRNKTGTMIPIGTPVYVTGVHIPGHPIHGHHPTIAPADATDSTKSNVIGITGQDIMDGMHGYVVTRGWIGPLDTSMLIGNGAPFYNGFSAPGSLTPYAPEYPNYPFQLGLCLTAGNAAVGTLYVDLSNESPARLHVQGSSWFDQDLTVGGNLTVQGASTALVVQTLNIGDNYVYVGAGNDVTGVFYGSGLNDASFTGHFQGNSDTSYYVKIDNAAVVPNTFAWSYDNFATTQATNVAITTQPQPLSYGISVQFQSQAGHTLGDYWLGNAAISNTDFGLVGNYVQGTYTHAGMFRDAHDNTFKFFRSYNPEPSGNIDTNDSSFALGNVLTERSTTNYLVVQGTAGSTGPSSGAATVAGGLGVSGNLFVGGILGISGSQTIGGALTAANVYSNGFVQAAGTVTAALINSNGAIVGASVTSNGAVQAAGAVTAASIVSNGAIQGATSVTANAVVSNVYGLFGQNVTINSTNASTATTNGALVVKGGFGVAGNVVSGGNLVVTNASSMSFIIASNSIVGASLVSNGAIQSAGNITVAGVNSNGTIVGSQIWSNSTIQSAGTATVNALVSNNNIFGATLNTSGLAQFANAVSNGDVKTATLNATATATVAGLNSNAQVQAVGTITGANIYSNGFVQAAGTITGGNVFSNGTVVGANVYSNGFIQAAGTITVGNVNSNGAVVGSSITSNSTVQAPGTITGGNVNSNGTVVGANLYSNGFVQAAGTITGANLYSNGFVQSAGTVTAALVNSNGTIVGANIYSNGFVQAAGTITVARVNSNGAIVGSSITSNSTVQVAGVATVNQLISNANIYGANINIAGLAYVNDLISNTNITANTLNSKGLTQTANLISNGYTTTATLNVTGNAQVADLTANTVIRTSTITSTGAAIFANISSNGTIQSAGTTTVNALISNTNVFGATLQSSGQALVGSLTSNTTIQSNGAAVFNSFTANTRSFITSGGFAVTGDSLVTGNLTVTGNLVFGGNAFTINTQSLTIVDPIIELGIGTGGTALTVDDGLDRGSYFDYFKNPPFNGETAGFNHAFLGFQSSSGRLIYITNVAPGNVNIDNNPENYPGIRFGAAVFGNIWLGNGIASTDTVTGGVVTVGGVGIGGNINVGGQRSNFTGNVNIAGSNAATNAATGALTVAGGAGVLGSLFVGGNLNANNGAQFSFVTTSNAITTASLFSNGIIQTAGTLVAGAIDSNGTVVGANLYSNGFVQAAGTITGGNVFSNGTVVGANVYSNGFVQAAGTVTAALVNSNGTIAGANVYSNGFVQAAGTVTAALVNSNGTIVGANLYSNGFVQAAGTAIVNAFYSNTFAQIAGTTTTNALVSNVYGLFGQNVTVNSTNASTSTTNGALVLGGGAGIAGNINVGGTRSLFTNYVGVGTTTALGVGNALAVYGNESLYGNLVISNTSASGSGIYFPDGSFQQTASTIGGVNKSVQFNDNGLFGGNSTFIYDKTNGQLGIGTATLTNTLMAYGATPAMFNTKSGSDQQIMVGNTTSDGAVLGFNSGVSTAYGYLKYTGAASTMLAFNKIGVGISGVTIPQNPLEVGGTTIIGSSWTGNPSFINPPSNGLSVQGSVGVGTFTPISKLDVRGAGSFTSDLNAGGTASVNVLIGNVYGLFGQNVTVNSTNASTSTTNGALVLGGGAGIAGNINVGGSRSLFTNYVGIGTSTPTGINSNVFTVYGTQMLYGNLDLGSTAAGGSGIYFADGTFQVTANPNPYTNVNVASYLSGPVVIGNLTISNTTASTSTTTGALLMGGGAGIQGNINVGGNLSVALASQLSFVIASNSIVGSSITSNGIIQSAGTATVNALVSNVYGQFGQNVTVNSTNASTATTNGALVVIGGIGVAGNVISGGNLVHAGASSLSFVIASNSIVSSSMTSNGTIQAAGTITSANIVSNGDVKTSTLNASSTATVGGLNSNAQVQAVGAVTAAYINSNGTIVGNNIYSNGFVQAAGTATVNALVSNVYGLFGQNVTINSTNAASATSATTGALVVAGGAGIASGLTTTGLVNFIGSGALEYTVRVKGSSTGDQFAIATNGTAGYGVANDALNAAGTAYSPYAVSASNVTIKTGTTSPTAALTITTFGNGIFAQNLTVGSSNASTTTGTGALIVTGGIGVAGNVISGGNLVHAGASSLSFVVASNSIVGSSLISNSSVQAATQVLANALVSNVYGLFGQNVTVNSTNASTATTNGALVVAGGIGVAGNVISGGNLVHAGASSLSFVIASNSIVGSSIYSNGIVQSAGTATVNAFYGNTFAQIAGTTTTNALVSNVYGLFGQNVTVNSTNSSTSTTTGALVLGGGAGIAGNINVGGTRSLFTNYVGIGTSTPTGINSNVFSVYGTEMLYGNLKISNTTPGGSGIYFPDGTFQTSAGGPPTNIVRQTFTSTANQSVFTVTSGYTVGQLDVYQSGARLVSGVDYTATDGSTFTLTVAVRAGVTIDVVSVNTLSYTVGSLSLAGGTVTGGTVFSSTTPSTSTGTGAVVVSGGVGVGGTVTAGNLVIPSGNLTVTYTPTVTIGTAIRATGKDTQGGTGYFDFLKATNTTTGATNPDKTFRLNSTGAIEIINSAYSSTLLSLTDAGGLSVLGPISVGGKQAVNGPAFSAYAAATLQTITSGSQQKVLFQTEEFDTNNNYANSRFTPTVEGYYQLNAQVRLDGASGTGEYMIILYKNGAEYKRGWNGSGVQIATNFWAMTVSSVVYANGTGDYFEIYVQQTSGGSLTVTAVAATAITWFNGCMLRGG